MRSIGAQNICAFALVLGGCAAQPSPATPTPSAASQPAAAEPTDAVIEDCARVPELVGREVTLVGTQTRSKIPTVCGVDVDGSYAFSDQKVIVRGVIKKTVVNEVEPGTANRGTGTFYSIIDGHTGALAKTSLR